MRGFAVLIVYQIIYEYQSAGQKKVTQKHNKTWLANDLSINK